MTKNGTPTPVYLDPGMHPGLEVKGLNTDVMGLRPLESLQFFLCGDRLYTSDSDV